MKRNVIALDILNSHSELPSGVKDLYYMYYKSDGDLYMYDSLQDTEYNLFHLNSTPKGAINMNASKVNKGTLLLLANAIKHGVLTCIANLKPSIVVPSGNGRISVNVLQEGFVGMLTMTANYIPNTTIIHVNVTQE